MKYLSKKVKLGALNTFKNCLQYNPLGYDESEKLFIYYNILKDATEKGLQSWCGLQNGECILVIDGYKQER